MGLFIQLPLVVCQRTSALKCGKIERLAPKSGAAIWWGANVDHLVSPSTYLSCCDGSDSANYEAGRMGESARAKGNVWGSSRDFGNGSLWETYRSLWESSGNYLGIV